MKHILKKFSVKNFIFVLRMTKVTMIIISVLNSFRKSGMLSHFSSMFHFYTPWNRQKTFGIEPFTANVAESRLTRKRRTICSKLTIKTLTKTTSLKLENRFHTFFWSFHCWLWANNGQVGWYFGISRIFLRGPRARRYYLVSYNAALIPIDSASNKFPPHSKTWKKKCQCLKKGINSLKNHELFFSM